MLLVPAATWFLVLFVTPLAIAVAYAFARKTGFSTYVFGFDLGNFERLGDAVYLRVMRTTAGIALASTLGCLVLAYPFAYWLATRVHRRRTVALLFVIVPFWMSLLVRTYAWILLLNETGPLSHALQRVGVLGEPLGILHTRSAVVIGLIYDYLPLMIFPLYVSIERLDRSVLEAARDLGAGRWATFRRVTLPLTKPGVLAGSLLVFIPAMGEYVVPSLLGGARAFTAGNLIADQFLQASDWPFGAALSLTMIAAMLATVALFLRSLGRDAGDMLDRAL